MAGTLYLQRLFVYHCESERGSVMGRRLMRAIINPAMIVTWLAGLYLAWAGHWYLSLWSHAFVGEIDVSGLSSIRSTIR
jgi:putative membrane protein